jgi:hypothetical protein
VAGTNGDPIVDQRCKARVIETAHQTRCEFSSRVPPAPKNYERSKVGQPTKEPRAPKTTTKKTCQQEENCLLWRSKATEDKAQKNLSAGRKLLFFFQKIPKIVNFLPADKPKNQMRLSAGRKSIAKFCIFFHVDKLFWLSLSTVFEQGKLQFSSC